CLRINDTGPGIDPKIQDRIFEPYFTTKGIGEGTGLGLATVHGIVESHRGVIKLYSEPGHGTTFSIYLPRHSIDTGPAVTLQESLESGSERILLIDDEMSLVVMGARMLQHLGYQVTMRTSSLEALELFRSEPGRFDLVITDQTMPQMTGLELAKELLKIRRDIPIILCTGFSSSVTPETIQATGIRGLVMKPMLMQEISKTIRTVMENKDR
ncbi:MAG: response regulator, partial [Deltaproteobacteria bacterium]|nr:response regulator [Deltaproteobacteria bacterium]